MVIEENMNTLIHRTPSTTVELRCSYLTPGRVLLKAASAEDIQNLAQCANK